MKYHFDTEKCKDTKLRFDRNANLEEIITKFCFSIGE